MGKSIFGPWDYAVLAAMLCISAGIGIYYRFTGGRQRTTQEYLLGDRSLSVLPVAVSLMASFMSAITLLGVSSENYTFGTQFVVINFSYALATPICAYCYLPVFFRLQATSAYHYLELRFGKTARLAASFAFSLQMVLYMGIVLYAPALTLEAVTGLSKTAAILSIGIVCTFYSTIGGMKAVVITDVFQSLLMFAAIYVVVIKATVDAGGLVEIWQIAVNGGRIEFDNIDPDPTVRHTWWSLIIGGGFTYMSLYAVNQAQVQRLLSIKNLRRSQTALWISWPVLTLLSISTCFSGIAIYSKYYSCDPLKDGRISQYDQLMPLYVVESLGHLPGLSGLFVAGIFSGSLSTVSSAVNSLSAVTLEDYIKPLYQRCNGFPLADSRSGYISKFLALLYGVLCLCIAFAAQHLGGVLQASLTIFGVVGGPLLGLFTLGMFIPVANETGAVSGLLAGLMIALWIGFGGPKPPPKLLPMRTDGCMDINLQNVTTPVWKDSPGEETFILYKLSYMWYVVIGFIVTMVVGIVISVIVNKIWRSSKTDPDDDLFAPVVQRLLTRRRRNRSLFAYTAEVRNANGIEVIKVSPEFDRRSITSEKHKLSESSAL